MAERPDHDVLLSIEGKLDAVLERMGGDDEIQPIPKRCVKQNTLIRSQWVHIRAIWGLIGAVGLAVLVFVLSHWSG